MAIIEPLSPLSGLGLPMRFGHAQISEVVPGPVYAIMPFKGASDAVSQVLMNRFGLELPGTGQTTQAGGVTLFWAGLDTWFLQGETGALPDMPASVTDQSDGWAVLLLEGEAQLAVMSRLVPIDVSDMAAGSVARTEFAHMASIVRRMPGGFEIRVMRSFGETALHELKAAAEAVEAIRILRLET